MGYLGNGLSKVLPKIRSDKDANTNLTDEISPIGFFLIHYIGPIRPILVCYFTRKIKKSMNFKVIKKFKVQI
jgi:hypothetical protein